MGDYNLKYVENPTFKNVQDGDEIMTINKHLPMTILSATSYRLKQPLVFVI